MFSESVFTISPDRRNRSLLTYLKYQYLGRGRRNFYSHNFFFYSQKMSASFKRKMSFEFTHPPFCTKSKFFKTLRPRCRQYSLIMNPVGILDRRWCSIEQQWEQHNAFFWPLIELHIHWSAAFRVFNSWDSLYS